MSGACHLTTTMPSRLTVGRPAQDLAQREQAQLPLQAAGFYTQLGRCEREAGIGNAARPLFQRALALRR